MHNYFSKISELVAGLLLNMTAKGLSERREGNARDLLLWNESTLLTEEYKRNRKGNRYFPVFPKMYTILRHH